MLHWWTASGDLAVGIDHPGKGSSSALAGLVSAASRLEALGECRSALARGVASSRVHAWTEQAGPGCATRRPVVVVRKPRVVCAEPTCGRRAFTRATEQLPVRAQSTTRLRTAALDG